MSSQKIDEGFARDGTNTAAMMGTTLLQFNGLLKNREFGNPDTRFSSEISKDSEGLGSSLPRCRLTTLGMASARQAHGDTQARLS